MNSNKFINKSNSKPILDWILKSKNRKKYITEEPEHDCNVIARDHLHSESTDLVEGKFPFKELFNIADEIWFLSGDRSTDMNYYSKRIILMNVYASVFSYFVFDKSKNAHKTLNFLERKINFVLTFGKMKGKLQSFFSR